MTAPTTVASGLPVVSAGNERPTASAAAPRSATSLPSMGGLLEPTGASFVQLLAGLVAPAQQAIPEAKDPARTDTGFSAGAHALHVDPARSATGDPEPSIRAGNVTVIGPTVGAERTVDVEPTVDVERPAPSEFGPRAKGATDRSRESAHTREDRRSRLPPAAAATPSLPGVDRTAAASPLDAANRRSANAAEGLSNPELLGVAALVPPSVDPIAVRALTSSSAASSQLSCESVSSAASQPLSAPAPAVPVSSAPSQPLSAASQPLFGSVLFATSQLSAELVSAAASQPSSAPLSSAPRSSAPALAALASSGSVSSGSLLSAPPPPSESTPIAGVQTGGRAARASAGRDGSAGPVGPRRSNAAGATTDRASDGIGDKPALHIENIVSVLSSTSQPLASNAPPSVAAATADPHAAVEQHQAETGLATALARVRRGPDGVHELDVALHPADLGEVRVRVVLHEGTLDVTVACAHEAARDAVSAALPALHRDLTGLGSVDVVPQHDSVIGATDREPRQHAHDGHMDTPERDNGNNRSRKQPTDEETETWL